MGLKVRFLLMEFTFIYLTIAVIVIVFEAIRNSDSLGVVNVKRLLFAFVLVVCINSAGMAVPVKFNFQHALIEGYNHGLCGVMTLGDQITSDPINADKFTVNLKVNYKPVQVGLWTFRRDGEEYVVKALKIPEWYQREVREYATDDNGGLIDAVLSQTLTVAGGFTSWLNGQQEVAVSPQSGSAAAVSEELPPAYLVATITLQGRLATVTLSGWKLLLEARQQESGWKLEVIAFERAGQ